MPKFIEAICSLVAIFVLLVSGGVCVADAIDCIWALVQVLIACTPFALIAKFK